MLHFVSFCGQGTTGVFGELSTQLNPSESTYLLDPSHPLVQNVDNPAFGSFASHTFFSSIGEDWVSLTENEYGQSTLVYKDRFVIHCLTIEYSALGWTQQYIVGNFNRSCW